MISPHRVSKLTNSQAVSTSRTITRRSRTPHLAVSPSHPKSVSTQLSPNTHMLIIPRRLELQPHRLRQNLRRHQPRPRLRLLLQRQTLQIRVPARPHALPPGHIAPQLRMGLLDHDIRHLRLHPLRLGSHHVRCLAGRAVRVYARKDRVPHDAAAGRVCDGQGGGEEDGHG
jgi:hypothetical protein